LYRKVNGIESIDEQATYLWGDMKERNGLFDEAINEYEDRFRWARRSGQEESEESERERMFVSDERGVNAAWGWRNLDFEGYEVDGVRVWGFVMWDRDRLEDWLRGRLQIGS
jgi:hypothetical protein